ncbi:MAG: hypothetical protein R3B93_11665 [Bacteroidia bacterium]
MATLPGLCFKYDEGRLMINGIQLLQDNADEKLYYYIPHPRLANKEDGLFELPA